MTWGFEILLWNSLRHWRNHNTNTNGARKMDEGSATAEISILQMHVMFGHMQSNKTAGILSTPRRFLILPKHTEHREFAAALQLFTADVCNQQHVGRGPGNTDKPPSWSERVRDMLYIELTTSCGSVEWRHMKLSSRVDSLICFNITLTWIIWLKSHPEFRQRETEA